MKDLKENIDDFQQQIRDKIKRIDLRDFGFERTPSHRSQSSFDQNIKFNLRPRLDSRPTPVDRLSRRTGNTDSFIPEVYSPYDRRNTFEEPKDRSSPVDWISTPNRSLLDSQNIGLRRAYNFSTHQEPKIDTGPFRRQHRDCSQSCLPKKYLQHYFAKECVPVIDPVCNCAVRFNCPSRESLKNITGTIQLRLNHFVMFSNIYELISSLSI